MKNVLLTTASLFVLTIFVLSSQTSCKKETVTVTKKDTVYIPTKKDTVYLPNPTLTRTQILLAKTWRMDMVNLVSGCSFSSYVLGGANTTGANYDNIRLTFFANGTGSHVDQFGNTYPTSWNFTSADQRSLNLTVSGVTYLWNMVEIANNYLHGSTQITLGGNSNNLQSFRMVQVP